MKSLFIGDPHFKTDNTYEIKQFIEQCMDIISNTNPDFVVIGGDLLHTHERLHVTPLNLCYDFIKRISQTKELYILVGNHDYISNQQWCTTNHWMNGMKQWKNVKIIDYPLLKRMKSGTDGHEYSFLFTPYVPNGKFLDTLKLLEEKEGCGYYKKTTCIYSHQEFKGCDLGHSMISDNGDLIDSKNYNNIVSGHIHKNQKLGNGIYYPGSPMQHTFSDEERNVISTLEYDKYNNMSIYEHEICLPKKITKYIESIDDFLNLSVNDIITNKLDRIRLIVFCQQNELKNIKRTKHYKCFINKNIKISFQIKLKNIVKDIECNNDNIFEKVLLNLLKSNKDVYNLYKNKYSNLLN